MIIWLYTWLYTVRGCTLEYPLLSKEHQKQPFADAFLNRFSSKFRSIHRKTSVLEPLQHSCFPVNIVKFWKTAFYTGGCFWNVKQCSNNVLSCAFVLKFWLTLNINLMLLFLPLAMYICLLGRHLNKIINC